MCFILYGVYVSSVADLDRPKKNVLRLGQNATDRNSTLQTVIERANNRDRSWITVTYLSASVTHRLITTTACYEYRNTTKKKT